ncbi:MAG: DUF389 domain-containing protein [Acidobacteria bacterium]|nr:DUF389 domain-containing protein [Acidobacteriota bacterium]
MSRTFREHIESLLRIPPDSKPEIYREVFNSSETVSLNYALGLLFSAGIATLGLVLNSSAVVIGAMLISPLMGPILAAGLALAASDLYLGIKSLLSLAIGVVFAILFSAGLVWILPIQTATSEILARTQPNLLDLGVALISGLAGSVVVCRRGAGGGVTALPGVAIAVALMPPLCTVGFGVGSGFSWPIISGAGLLFLTNLAAIIASAFLVFYVVRMDAPDVRAQIDSMVEAEGSHDQLYRILKTTGISGALGHLGGLRARILMLVAVMSVLFVPLSRSLLQVAGETRCRAAVREALRLLGPAETFVAQQVDITARNVVIRLVAAAPVPKERIDNAEKLLIRRTGREVSLTVRRVASEEDLAVLRQQLSKQAAPAPPADLQEIAASVVPRLEQALKTLWPDSAGELLAYELGFAPEGVVVRIRYRSAQPLDSPAADVLSQALESQLNVERIRLELEAEKPAAPKPVPRARR